jgi:hypothetical protein
MCGRPAARRVWVAVLASFAVSLLISYVDHRKHAFGDLSQGRKSDHFTHMHAARLFPRFGFRLHREPASSFLESLEHNDEKLSRLSVDDRAQSIACGRGAWNVAEARPAYLNWSQLPRPYPLGDMLLFAPVAMLYEWTPISFAVTNWLLIVTCLISAHVGLYFMWQAVHETWNLAPTARWAVCFLLAIPVIWFSLDGFYDGVLIAPLVLTARWIDESKWTCAMLAFVLAVFCHYRALVFAPYGIVATIGVARSVRALSRADVARLLLAATLAAFSVYTFLLVAPSLRDFPLTNPVHPAIGHPLATAAVATFAMLAATLLWRLRSPLDAAIAATVFLFLLAIRQVQIWHVVAIIPWIVAPLASKTLSSWWPRLIRVASVGVVYLVLTS